MAALPIALAALWLAAVCFPAPCSAQLLATAPLEAPALVALAREYGKNKPAEPPAAAGEQAKAGAASVTTGESEEDYRFRMGQYLMARDFTGLEKEVHDIRSRKLRFPGGVWKLAIFYEGLTQPLVGADPHDADYQAHFANLRRWQAACPESPAPLIALAESYQGYAFLARGDGYASTVTAEGWRLFDQRINASASYLADAAQLKEKDPYWYESMQHISVYQGWEKAQAAALLASAVAFEPGYYHYYREHALYLLPKWHGEPGDAEAFAEEASNRVGGKYGKMIYYEIATLLTCQCDSDDSDMENLNWQKIKEGYAALVEQYGTSRVKENRFAHMAVEANDRGAAREAFAMIGENWESNVWHTPDNFRYAKAWAARQ